MANNNSNFNFCPTCYDEGCRFLEVTDEQKGSINKFYEDELKKKDQLIYMLHKSIDSQKKEHEEALAKQRLEYEAKLSKREDIITSLQNTRNKPHQVSNNKKCDSKQEQKQPSMGRATLYIQNAREEIKKKAAKGKAVRGCSADSVLKEVGKHAATADQEHRQSTDSTNPLVMNKCVMGCQRRRRDVTSILSL